MKLIKEVTETVSYLAEEKDGKKSLYIQGPFLQAEVVNRNGRKYLKEVMQKEVQRFIKKQKNYVVLTVSGLSLDGGGNAAKHYLQNSVIVSTWMQIT